jgi:cytochrome c-type biogenesis protein CcmH/NrfG
LVEARPNSAPLHALLGRWYLDHGKLREARSALEAAKSADPAFVEAEFALADLDRRENRQDAARDRLRSIVRVDPGNVAALLMLAGLEQARGNRDLAISRFREVLKIDESNAGALESGDRAPRTIRKRP